MMGNTFGAYNNAQQTVFPNMQHQFNPNQFYNQFHNFQSSYQQPNYQGHNYGFGYGNGPYY